jgi:hypothetical protein
MSYAPPPPSQPVPGYGDRGVPPKPKNYLVWAILATLLCCLPLGIVSIVQAAKVDSLYTSGQYGQAQRASESARKWAIIAAVTGLVLAVLYFAVFMTGMMGINGYDTPPGGY